MLIRKSWQALAIALLLLVASRANANTWPTLELPAGARSEVVADDMILNGLNSRVLRFDIKGTMQDAEAFFRQQLGPRIAENEIRGSKVLATRQGDYFVTVQLRELRSGVVQGTAMTTRLQREPGEINATSQLRKALPPDTAVLSTSQSDNHGRPAVTLVATNRATVKANRDSLLTRLADEGFRVAKEGTQVVDGHPTTVLQLIRDGEDVIVTISDLIAYRSLVINRVKEPH
ncbi:MAG TPA: hypothetical protein VFP68_03620 [Burkholderiaceae bacterium]|nr:hypothetical protein [Burkholderiaceae bacterium]